MPEPWEAKSSYTLKQGFRCSAREVQNRSDGSCPKGRSPSQSRSKQVGDSRTTGDEVHRRTWGHGNLLTGNS